MSDTADTIETGQVLGGRYRVGKLLGRGGMGAVFEAVQQDLHRRVAIKVLHPHLTANPDVVARFRREAEAAAALGHPNIIAVTDFHWGDGEPAFLVMELLAGEPLSRAIDAGGPMAGGRVAFITTQVLSALAAAHAAGIVHRDLKPDNVFLTSVAGVRDLVKLLDFGVAKLAEPGGSMSGASDPSHKLTATGTVLGTPYYMSPEQARGRPVDARSDLYAAGVVMYEALTGRLPFRAENYNALLFAISGEQPTPLAQLRPDLPAGLVAAVERAMAKDPAARFASADEFARALEPFSQASVTSASSPHVARVVAHPAPAATTPDAQPFGSAPTALSNTPAPPWSSGAFAHPTPGQPQGRAPSPYPAAAASHPPHPPAASAFASAPPPLQPHATPGPAVATPFAFSNRPAPPSTPAPPAVQPPPAPYRAPTSLPRALALVGVALLGMCAVSRLANNRGTRARREARVAVQGWENDSLRELPSRIAAALDAAGVPLSDPLGAQPLQPVPAVVAPPLPPSAPEPPREPASPQARARAAPRARLGGLGGSPNGVYAGGWTQRLRPHLGPIVERCLSLPGYATHNGNGYSARLRIGPDGRVAAIESLRPATPQPARIDRCVQGMLRRIELGPPDNGTGGPVEISFSEQHP